MESLLVFVNIIIVFLTLAVLYGYLVALLRQNSFNIQDNKKKELVLDSILFLLVFLLLLLTFFSSSKYIILFFVLFTIVLVIVLIFIVNDVYEVLKEKKQ